MNREAEEAGLVDAGLNSEGEQLYIGTSQQWQKYDNLCDEGRKSNFSCPVGAFRSENGCVYDK
jgi:hypothetical protein